MKLGICGTGIFARDSHLPALKKNQIEVVACANRTKAKAEAFAKAAGSHVVVCDSLEELAKAGVDALDILVPVDQNLAAVKTALESGLPFCFEKPIAHNLEDGREIVKLTSNAAVPVMILENWVYHNATVALQKLVPQIGKLHMFSYQDTKPYQPNKFHETAWRQAPKHVGGYLSDAGVHDIAFLAEVVGPVKAASANVTQFQAVSGGPDGVTANLQLESGAFGTYVFSTGVNSAKHELTFQLFGSEGSLYYRQQDEFGTAVLRTKEGETVTEIVPDEIDGLVPEFANFASAVAAKDPSLVAATPAKGFHHLAVVVAMVESAEAGGKLVEVQKV